MLFVTPDFQELIRLITPYWGNCDYMKIYRKNGKWFALVIIK